MNARILYVDASGRSWRNAEAALADGYTVIDVPPDELDARLAAQDYVAVLLDLDLATTLGGALHAPVKVPQVPTPVVLVTQRARECSADDLRQHGADCAIPKPATLAQVTLAITEWHLRR
ncbi:MAG: DNA-binding response OmpR family regulator [Polyangiales bacterium]|jgi:DNA-binding response OmpR family regulator